jgi:hypothetical protein
MRRKSNSQTIGEVIRQMILRYRLSDKLVEARFRDSLEQMFGSEIARFVVSIQFARGTATISIRNAALKNELSYSREKLIEAMNSELGEVYVKKVVIV